jgi:RNA exonuclease 4
LSFFLDIKFKSSISNNGSSSTYDARDDEQSQVQDALAAAEPKAKKKRARGRRRKAKARNKVEPTHKNQPSPKKHHDAPMKKRDLYFSMTCSMVAIKGGASVVARVAIVNWDMETVLDSFVHVPVPVADFKDSGISPGDIRKSGSNTKAKCFSEVRQLVEQILRGKILIGHQLSEKLTALGLTHPSTDVRDTSIFFKDSDLSNLTQKLLGRDLLEPASSDFSLESCSAALDLYKTYRKKWEEDLIQKAQQSQQQLFMQMKTASPPPSPQYNVYHMQEPQRPRFPSYEMNPQAMVHGFAQPVQVPQSTPPQNYHENSSWFVRGNPSMAAPAQPASTPVLSSRAMQALSSYSNPSSPRDDVYEHGSSMSYDGSTLYSYESSTDYTESVFDNSSVASESAATASVASWQEEDVAAESTSSSSWFRFGSRKASSSTSNPTSPYSQKAERRMSAVCEEQEDEIAAASEELQPRHLSSAPYEPARYFSKEGATEESPKQLSSWFGFRRSKSPGPGKREKVPDEEKENDELNNSRSHASPDLTLLSLETLSGDSTPSDETMQLSSEDGGSEMAALNDELPEMEQTGEKASSWFSFRRSKSPITTTKQAAASMSNENVMPEPTESTYTGDDDWLQEVMDKPSEKDVALSKDDASIDGLEEPSSSSPPSTWFGFLRSPKTTRSRLPSLDDSLDDDAMKTQPSSSFDEETDGWFGQAMNSNNNNSAVGDGWNGSPAATGGLFFSPARSRLPTESTIQTVATEENVEDEGCLSQDLFEFLNI